jgi:CheY-like chemotaxis protein
VSGDAPILLVEDDRDEVDVALRAIRRAGVGARVRVARDGQAALEALGIESASSSGESTARPCVVFLDLKLPRVDGWEVLRRLRADPATAKVPVVVISSSDEGEDVGRSYALGANSFVVKRFDERGPGHYFAEAARYWVELNRPAADRNGPLTGGSPTTGPPGRSP